MQLTAVLRLKAAGTWSTRPIPQDIVDRQDAAWAIVMDVHRPSLAEPHRCE